VQVQKTVNMLCFTQWCHPIRRGVETNISAGLFSGTRVPSVPLLDWKDDREPEMQVTVDGDIEEPTGKMTILFTDIPMESEDYLDRRMVLSDLYQKTGPIPI
jgi:hypothetical protein